MICACGCGKPVPPKKLKGGAVRKYASIHCRERAERKRNAGKWRARKTRYQNSVRGRVCKWCGITDAQARWSNVRVECSACHRQGQPSRNGRCEKCRAPLYRRTTAPVVTLGCWPAVLYTRNGLRHIRVRETYCKRCEE